MLQKFTLAFRRPSYGSTRTQVAFGYVILISLVALNFWPKAFSAPAGTATIVEVGVGPTFGNGTMSNGAKIQATGLVLQAEAPFALSEHLKIAPGLHFANQIMTTSIHRSPRATNSAELSDPSEFNLAPSETQAAANATYDHREFGAGLSLMQSLTDTSAPFRDYISGIFISGIAGKTYTKITLDDAQMHSFEQVSLTGIHGIFYRGELGANIPVRDNVGIVIALASTHYDLDQSAYDGSSSPELANQNQKTNFALTYSPDSRKSELPDKISQDVFSGRMAIALFF